MSASAALKVNFPLKRVLIAVIRHVVKIFDDYPLFFAWRAKLTVLIRDRYSDVFERHKSIYEGLDRKSGLQGDGRPT